MSGGYGQRSVHSMLADFERAIASHLADTFGPNAILVFWSLAAFAYWILDQPAVGTPLALIGNLGFLGSYGATETGLRACLLPDAPSQPQKRRAIFFMRLACLVLVAGTTIRLIVAD
jgi:hypothetical protein